MTRHSSLFVACALALAAASAASVAAEKKQQGFGTLTPAPGTGSNYSSDSVRGYVRKDGTYVAPHQRSQPDQRFDNNWKTKGNENPYTGEAGSRVTQPAK